MKATDLKVMKEDDWLISVVWRLNDVRDYLIELEKRVEELENKLKTKEDS